ncbi:MAG: hydroxysqualene dehydroxylase HpnE [Gammaproteobacteria bacterium]
MPEDVLVIGAGWAGLAAAVALSAKGIPVHLIEAAPQAGGRARAAGQGPRQADNGQHLLLGAYTAILGLQKLIGLDEKTLYERRPLSLTVYRDGSPPMGLALPRLPSPLHLAAGLLQARGLRWRERIEALLHAGVLTRIPAVDLSVSDFLAASGQPETLIRELWAPLCLAAMNTPPETASAQVFARVLRETFLAPRRYSDLLLPRVDLSALLPLPALAYLQERGARISFKTRVQRLIVGDTGIEGVETRDGPLAASRVVLATDTVAAARLLAGHPQTAALGEGLVRLGAEPICTVYLQFPPQCRLPTPMMGFSGTTLQWLFDRRLTDAPGLFAAVISGPGEHMLWDAGTLLERIADEIRRFLPDLPEPEDGWVIREKRATFHCGVGSETDRPGNRTPLDGLWLAGDYTRTGLPATLEGAVRSGLECARAMTKQLTI